MEHHGSSERRTSDEVSIARQTNRSISDGNHNDDVVSTVDGNNCSGKARTVCKQNSNDDVVLRNPGVSFDDEDYRMNNEERGVALIFCHKLYEDDNLRKGIEVDRDKLQDTFKSLGFKVYCFNDLTFEEIKSELKSVSKQNHEKRDCLAVAVLSDGKGDGMLLANDISYPVSKLWEPFTARKCGTLAGKPKLFFIQACRGKSAEPGVTMSNIVADGPDSGDGLELTFPVPSYADILVSYATFEDNVAFLDENCSSWYIQTLCSQLKDHAATKDLVSLLTRVNRLVGQKFRSENEKNPCLHGMLQAPCFTSALTRRLCFGCSGDSCPQYP